jgi:hypothetical protein
VVTAFRRKILFQRKSISFNRLKYANLFFCGLNASCLTLVLRSQRLDYRKADGTSATISVDYHTSLLALAMTTPLNEEVKHVTALGRIELWWGSITTSA